MSPIAMYPFPTKHLPQSSDTTWSNPVPALISLPALFNPLLRTYLKQPLNKFQTIQQLWSNFSPSFVEPSVNWSAHLRRYSFCHVYNERCCHHNYPRNGKTLESKQLCRLIGNARLDVWWCRWRWARTLTFVNLNLMVWRNTGWSVNVLLSARRPADITVWNIKIP